MKDLEEIPSDAGQAETPRDQAKFIEVGDGVVPVKAVVDCCREHPVPWMIVEQDRPARLEPWASAERSLRNLQTMLSDEG
jgi:sugar phosphate isomerase/epimerase